MISKARIAICEPPAQVCSHSHAPRLLSSNGSRPLLSQLLDYFPIRLERQVDGRFITCEQSVLSRVVTSRIVAI